MLWTDKYRPQDLSEVVGNKKEIKIITDWVKAWKNNDPQIRENLETKFAIDRGKIDLELTQEKDKINKAIKNYEDNLLFRRKCK